MNTHATLLAKIFCHKSAFNFGFKCDEPKLSRARIFFNPSRLEKRLSEFVVDYKQGELDDRLKLIPDAPHATSGTSGTHGTDSDGYYPTCLPDPLENLVTRTLKLERTIGNFEEKCLICQKRGHLDYQITEHDGSFAFLCADCGLELEKRLATK